MRPFVTVSFCVYFLTACETPQIPTYGPELLAAENRAVRQISGECGDEFRTTSERRGGESLLDIDTRVRLAAELYDCMRNQFRANTMLAQSPTADVRLLNLDYNESIDLKFARREITHRQAVACHAATDRSMMAAMQRRLTEITMVGSMDLARQRAIPNSTPAFRLSPPPLPCPLPAGVS